MIRQQLLSSALLLSASYLCLGATRTLPVLPYQDSTLAVEARVDDLLGRMTLEEKMGQVTMIERDTARNNSYALKDLGVGSVLSGGGQYPQPNTPAGWADMVDGFQRQALSSRLGIPIVYGVDAVHGHAALNGAVVFPHNIGLGATNDPDLLHRIGRVTALEVKGSGVHWNFAPMIGLPQDARWGRTYEGYSETTDIVSRLGGAYLEGLQTAEGQGLEHPWTVLASAKHFIGDGAAKWGTSPIGQNHIDRGNAAISEETLRAVHLPPYAEVIAKGARNIMVSYSSWGGLKMHEQRYLLTTVLKGELGFSGFLVSDWEALKEIPGSTSEQLVKAMNAGLDMIMVPTNFNLFLSDLRNSLQNGQIPQSRLNDAVRRILRVKFELGLFERPYANRSQLNNIGSAAHRQVAREAVTKSLVALKANPGALPLKATASKFFVAGNGADNLGIQSGGWTLEWQGVKGNLFPGTTFIGALKSVVRDDNRVVFQEQGYFPGNDKAPVGIVVMGEQPYSEMQGDKADLNLSWEEKELINRVRARCDTLVVVLYSGRPLIVSKELELSDAFIAAWLPGSEGAGITDALFDSSRLTGRLSYTWPRSMAYFENKDRGLPQTRDTVLFPVGYSALK